MPTPTPFSIVIQSHTSHITPSVERILDEAEMLGLVPIEERFKLAMALEEAITNAVVHGNLEVDSELRESGDDLYERTIEERSQDSQFGTRQVSIQLAFSRTQCDFIITDQGPGFDVGDVADPTQEEFLDRPSGRGIAIMRAFLDEVQFNDRGNQVILTRHIAHETAANTPHSAQTQSTAVS